MRPIDRSVRAAASSALAAAALAVCVPASAQQPASRPAAAAASAPSADLPLDPAVTVGTLPNGMRYYVRENRRPEKRAELRLVVKAGSVLEDDDQRGLAHFLEHMAFNGTRGFEKQELVNYLERVGMRFGPDINASTSFDETIYYLQLPTDSAGIVSTGFRILEEWARFVVLDSAEIERERGVVIEEWRGGQGADSRMRDKALPVILQGSRYAERMPIGDTATLAGFRHSVLRKFYADWYRPDLMAVVAVGDFDKAAIERLIRTTFSDWPRATSPRERRQYGVPAVDTTRVVVVTDPEATQSGVSVSWLQPEARFATAADYRARIVRSLFTRMLNQRLFEITQRPDAPFISAGTSYGSFLGDRDAFSLSASVKDGGIPRGLEAVLTEARRVRDHGFTTGELERQKQNFLRAIERAYDERDKSESAGYAEEYVAHFLDGEPSPGIAYEFDLYKRVMPGIALTEINRLAAEWIGPDRLVTAQAPEKQGVPVPTRAELLATFDRVEKASVVAYADSAASGDLVESPPAPGRVVKREAIPDVGVTRLTLSNGVRVLLKPTDFKADQVLLRGWSPGGSSLLADADFPKARAATTLLAQGGIGRFSRIDLQKVMTGKAASAGVSIGELSEEASGQASPKDLETMMQLVHLHFTAPRADSAAVVALKQRQRAALENRGLSPEAAFVDTLTVLMSGSHPRARPVSVSMVDSLDLARSLAFYRDRFSDAGDFVFVIAGAFDTAQMVPLVERWLGSLPATGRKETGKDLGMRPVSGVAKRVVRKGTEPKATTQLVFHGDAPYSREERYALTSLAEVLTIRLRDKLREALGGTYGVSVGADLAREPRSFYQVGIGFGSAPDRAESLVQEVLAEIDSIKAKGATAQEIEKVREIQRRETETGMKENAFWLSALLNAERYGEDPRQIPRRSAIIETLTPNMVRDAARKYLDTSSYIQVMLLPEGAKTVQ